MKKYFTYIFSLVALFACGPTPEKLIEKAQAALKREDSETALLYMKNAYEVSLPKEYFLLDRELSFSRFKASKNGSHVLLVEKKIPRKEFESLKITLLDRPKKKTSSTSVKGKILDAYLSHNGKFAAFLQKPDSKGKNCRVIAWNIEDDNTVEAGACSCETKPAIASTGVIYLFHNEKIHVFDVKTGKPSTEVKYTNRPDRPLKKFVAYAYFYLSPEDIPYMTYGAAGKYKLYSLKKGLKVLTKELSSNRVSFIPGSELPGVVIGGAGVHQFVFFNPDTPGKIAKRMKVKNWGDVAFVSEKHYYYIEDAILTERKGKDEEELPFWAEQIAIGQENELLFLSSAGSAMRYQHKMPPEESLKIYEKGVEIDDSK